MLFIEFGILKQKLGILEFKLLNLSICCFHQFKLWKTEMLFHKQKVHSIWSGKHILHVQIELSVPKL